ncbi:MltA domain-containing protein [Thalassotalea marina]|uniref:Lytic transglycosylase MltA domain-containing protein n=1 Tax=Thalassotalea marina TaxID=1673741 RepID=A0A919BHA4_9GAMM|nr:MltA domain-containing protein [Thalassotalea marina]GHF87898.1 hypothetical protein GCM10017161_14440 [Thalassotalea marina]
MKYLYLLLCLSFSTQAQFVLDKSPNLHGSFSVDSQALCQVAKNTVAYMQQYPEDSFAVHAGNQVIEQATLARVKKTLSYVCQMPLQSLTLDGLKQHFDFYHWLPDKTQANKLAKASDNQVKKRLLTQIPEQQIFLTKYYSKLLKGSEVQTKEFNQALYALPFDEQGLTIEQALQQKDHLTRFKYTRQQIIGGVLNKQKLAKPLVWISEQALHDVLLQGTGVLDVNGKRRYFNVHRNNGINYDYTLGKTEQARYWYFAEVEGVLGYGTDIENKIPIAADVAFAGNVKQLGLGKLFLIQFETSKTPSVHLGVLADQGGAFDNNLFQLDWLKSSYFGWKDYFQANKHFPDYAKAWLLLKKADSK